MFTDLASVLNDPANFPEPELFRPERFYDADAKAFSASSMVIPFGLGKRRYGLML